MRLLILWLCCLSLPAFAAPIPAGDGEFTADLNGVSLKLFTYRPSQCTPKSFLLVFHGVSRNAQGYRDHAKPIADGLCAIAIAPYFDKAHFSEYKYQRGGLTSSDSKQWTGPVIEQLVTWLRAQEQQPDWPYSMIGHSGGGQFLSRFAASTPNQAQTIVLANAGSYLFPSLEAHIPDGFGGMPDAEQALKRYLAAPLVLLLGDADIEQDAELPKGYMQQGSNRHERGLNFFQVGKKIAAERHWDFNWRLLEVPGVAHNAKRMFASPQALRAFQP